MVTGVSSLLKTVKDVESEAGKGVRTLENAIDAIEEAVKVIITHNNCIAMTMWWCFRSMTQKTLPNVMPVQKTWLEQQRELPCQQPRPFRLGHHVDKRM